MWRTLRPPAGDDASPVPRSRRPAHPLGEGFLSGWGFAPLWVIRRHRVRHVDDCHDPCGKSRPVTGVGGIPGVPADQRVARTRYSNGMVADARIHSFGRMEQRGTKG